MITSPSGAASDAKSDVSYSNTPGIKPQANLGAGPSGIARQIWGTMWVELVMQWRRWGLWAAFGGVTVPLLLITVLDAVFLRNPPEGSIYVAQHYTSVDLENIVVYGSTVYGAVLFGLVAALLVADRMERDLRLGMFDLQRATPRGSAAYTVGKVLGNYAAVIAPALGGYLVCGLATLALGWAPVLLWKFILAFVLVAVPCSLIAVTLSLLLASILPVRVVQVVFPLLWFEFYLGLGWHDLAASIFNIGGFYIYPVFFPLPPQMFSVMPIVVSMPVALLNIGALLAAAVVALCLIYASLVFRQYRAERA